MGATSARRAAPCHRVVDPHGDLAEEIARFKEHRNSDRLIYIDPYLDGSGGRMPTINPFELRDTSPQAIDTAAQSMLEAFKQILTPRSPCRWKRC